MSFLNFTTVTVLVLVLVVWNIYLYARYGDIETALQERTIPEDGGSRTAVKHMREVGARACAIKKYRWRNSKKTLLAKI